MLLYQSYVVFVCFFLVWAHMPPTAAKMPRGSMPKSLPELWVFHANCIWFDEVKSYLWLMQSYIHSTCNNRICSFFYSTKPYNVWLKCRDQYEDKFWEKVELLRNSLRKRWISKLDLKLNCSELSLHAFYVISFLKLFDLVSIFAYITLYKY